MELARHKFALNSPINVTTFRMKSVSFGSTIDGGYVPVQIKEMLNGRYHAGPSGLEMVRMFFAEILKWTVVGCVNQFHGFGEIALAHDVEVLYCHISEAMPHA